MSKPFEELGCSPLRIAYDSNGRVDKLIDEHGRAVFEADALTYKVPVIATAPVVTPGTATTGTVMNSTTGAWATGEVNPVTAYAYQWYKGGVAINGATASSYTVLVGDLGAAITCKVTATNRGGDSTASESNAVTPA